MVDTDYFLGVVGIDCHPVAASGCLVLVGTDRWVGIDLDSTDCQVRIGCLVEAGTDFQVDY